MLSSHALLATCSPRMASSQALLTRPPHDLNPLATQVEPALELLRDKRPFERGAHPLAEPLAALPPLDDAVSRAARLGGDAPGAASLLTN